MALSKAQLRELLSAAGVETDKISDTVNKIIDGHQASIEAIQEERDKYKADAEKLVKTEADLKEAQTKLKDLDKEDSYKVKYEALKEDFDTYKKDIETKKTAAAKETAYRDLLKEIGIADKRIDAVMKVSNLKDVKLTDDGKIDGADDLKKSLKTEWEDFIVTKRKEGADTKTPPENKGGSGKTKAEIMKIEDATERQEALKEYLLSQEEE